MRSVKRNISRLFGLIVLFFFYYYCNIHEIEVDKLCVLIPYRERELEISQLLPALPKLLTDQSIIFELLMINQTDHHPFNRGALINVGASESSKLNCTYICMHDVDLIPKSRRLKYAKPRRRSVMHLTKSGIHPQYNFPEFFGGISLIAMDDFKKIGGISAHFWGWGNEDDNYKRRLIHHGFTIDAPYWNDTRAFLHLTEGNLRDKKDFFNQRSEENLNDMKDYMNLEYVNTINTQREIIAGVPIVVVNVQFFHE